MKLQKHQNKDTKLMENENLNTYANIGKTILVFTTKFVKTKGQAVQEKWRKKYSIKKMDTDCGLRQAKNKTKHNETLLVLSNIFWNILPIL